MRILLLGAGGVGDAVAKLAATRGFFEHLVIADIDSARAERTVDWLRARHGEAITERFSSAQVNASDPSDVVRAIRESRATHVLNAVDPRFVPSIFTAAREAGANYIDMALGLSSPHPDAPYQKPGRMLGAEQFDDDPQWREAGLLALVGMGVEPGLSNVFARFAADYLFSEIDEIGTRDGANLVVVNDQGEPIFAPSFSIWTTIEECLNPPLIWERDRGWFTTEPFSEPEVFDFPAGIGPVECVNVEHEEVVLMPRWLGDKARRVTFKYGLGTEFIDVLKTLHRLGLDRTDPVRVRSPTGWAAVSPRDVVAAVLPDPATIGPRMRGKTCAGVFVTGIGVAGTPRRTYLYHVADNEVTMRDFDAQCVVWQTALGPVIALEMIARGEWSGVGVLGPEAFDAAPFMELMARPVSDGGYGQPFGVDER